MERIIIKDAHENNLKHLNLEIPLEKFTCVTGCSGCGKSSLVFDTIYADSQRAFLEGMTGNIYGQKLMNKPLVGSIENLRPALNISQNYYNVNPRSTVGTITEISYYLRSLFALANSDSSITVSEKIFSSNNPKSCCPNCAGLGVELAVSEALLIPDPDITLRDGAILLFKGPQDSKEQKFLEALCEHYGIDINKKFSQLRRDEVQILLYEDEKVKYKLTYKEGRRRKQHYVNLRGAVPIIKERISVGDSSGSTGAYVKYTESVPCHVCGGTKLRKEVLEYTIGGLNYNDIESMELSSLDSWIRTFKDERLDASKKDLTGQLVNSILSKLDALMQLDVGYLCLNRGIPTLSGGERQRVRIATQLTCSLKGLVYILDEPCKGLHYRDITKIVKSTRDLINRGNTVIAIEHNKQYISSSDNVIELGPVGGPNGGYLVNQYSAPTQAEYKLSFKETLVHFDYFEVHHINFRNIHDQNAFFPIGGISCITGVSGSGKSTLASVVASCFSRRANNTLASVQGGKSIRRVIQVNQSPIGKTPRSTVASYLEVFDQIRALFAGTSTAKRLKISASAFSINVKGGRCECCQGTGLQKIELNYLPDSYIICPECGGKRFEERILSVQYHGKSILDILETPISDIVDVFKDNQKVFLTLNSMIELGLGYLKLGQMSMNLSGGEAQRVKLAKALGSSSNGKNLYILDEPTSGLNDIDIDKFVQVLFKLQKNRETILIIEHNVEFIARVADHIVDFGLHGGADGGVIVAQGLPKAVFSNEASSLYQLDHLTF